MSDSKTALVPVTATFANGLSSLKTVMLGIAPPTKMSLPLKTLKRALSRTKDTMSSGSEQSFNCGLCKHACLSCINLISYEPTCCQLGLPPSWCYIHKVKPWFFIYIYIYNHGLTFLLLSTIECVCVCIYIYIYIYIYTLCACNKNYACLRWRIILYIKFT